MVALVTNAMQSKVVKDYHPVYCRKITLRVS